MDGSFGFIAQPRTKRERRKAGDDQITDRIDGFEQSARIVEALQESVFDEETGRLLTEIAAAIRDHAIND